MVEQSRNSFKHLPDENGRFGIHGGRFVAETLMPLILDVEKHYHAARTDKHAYAKYHQHHQPCFNL